MTTWFTRVSRATVLMVILIVAAGVGSLLTMGRQEDPTLVERYATVVTVFPGASAERVEALVTEPLEARILELAEVNEVESRTRASVSFIAVTLREDLPEAEVNQAWSLVREQIDLAAQSFPSGVIAPDLERQYIGAATMVVAVGWHDGADADIGLINRMALDLEDAFQALSGTEETQIFGAADEEVRVLADPDRLAALGLTTQDLAQVLAAADSKAPAGTVRSATSNLGVEIAGEFSGLERVRAVTVRQDRDGALVRVGDVARVEKGVVTPPEAIALINGERTIFVAAYLQPGLRADLWADQATALVERFAAGLPRGVSAEIVFDQAKYVDQRLLGLAGNLVMSAVIVFAVLFFMMGWRAALIVGSALPLTVLLVVLLIRLYGEPLHQMSVTGLVIALGLLIDNAIVMVDEIRLRRSRGASALEAVDLSVRHLFAPLMASTLTTVFAFAPIALMPGSAGEFIGMIGLSVIFAIVSSFALAMTVVPAFSAWFDRVPEAGTPSRWWRDGVSGGVLAKPYRALLTLVARVPAIGILIGISAPVAGFVLVTTLSFQFFPPTDRDMFQTEIILPTSTALEETRSVVEAASALIESYDGVVETGWVIGAAAPRTYYNVIGSRVGEPNYAAGWVRTESPAATRRIVESLQDEVRTAFPQARFLTLPFEQGPPVPAPIELRVVGPDFQVLDAVGDEVRRKLSESRNVTFTSSGLQLGAPVATLRADESAAALSGRRLSELAGLVRADLDGAIGGSVLEGIEELRVRVLLDDETRGTLNAVRTKALTGAEPGGLGAPLGAFGTVDLEPEVAVITRFQGERSNPIYGFIEPFTLPADALADFQSRLEASGFAAPAGYELITGGEAAEAGNALGNLFNAAAPLLILMIGSLVLAFNSFRYAAVIGCVGVLSVGLAFLGVWLFGQPLGFNAIVGAMGLIGLAINGSIVVLSALRTTPAALTGEVEPVVETTMEATRHILATTFTTVGGFVPLLLAADSFWMPLASAIAGGVAGSAVLALVFTPAVFALMMRRRTRREARRAARRATRGGAAQPAE